MAPSNDSITMSFAGGDKVPNNAILFSSENSKYEWFWMSNFHMESFKDDKGVTFSCGEAYFQSHKAWLVKDKAMFLKIAGAKSAMQAKTMGNAIKNLDIEKWNQLSSDVMGNALFFKIRNKIEWQEDLVATRDRLIVESRDDKVWGSGLGKGKTKSTKISQWPGENKLGEEWMELRAYFKTNLSKKAIEGSVNQDGITNESCDSGAAIDTDAAIQTLGRFPITPPKESKTNHPPPTAVKLIAPVQENGPTSHPQTSRKRKRSAPESEDSPNTISPPCRYYQPRKN